MDKINYLLFVLAILFLSGCDKTYQFDEDYMSVFKNYSIVISHINGFIQSDSGILVYGNASYLGRSKFVIPKGKFYGLIKLDNQGMLDTSFSIPFQKPTSVHKVLKLNNGKFLLFYKELEKTSKLTMALMNNSGQIEKINYDFNKIFPDTASQEYFNVDAAAKDSTGNIYFYVNTHSCEFLDKLIKLNNSFELDTAFQKKIADSFKISYIFDIQVQSDNKIVLGGTFIYSSKSKECKNICRIDSDGNIDESFGFHLPKFETDYDRIYTIRFFDSTIYCGGNFYLLTNNKKISDLIRINYDGSMFMCQPNNNEIIKYIDDEPYFNKSTIISINEIEDSLLIFTGIFNRINDLLTNIPIAIVSKNGQVKKTKFKVDKPISYIETLYYKNQDTLFVFGSASMLPERNLSFARMIRK